MEGISRSELPEEVADYLRAGALPKPAAVAADAMRLGFWFRQRFCLGRPRRGYGPGCRRDPYRERASNVAV